MNQAIFDKLKLLKDSIDNDPRYKKLKVKEDKLNDSFQAYTLANKKDELMEKYHSLTLAFDDNDPQVIALRREIIKTRNELENLEETKDYLSAYEELEEALSQVDLILFDNLKLVKGHKVKL